MEKYFSQLCAGEDASVFLDQILGNRGRKHLQPCFLFYCSLEFPRELTKIVHAWVASHTKKTEGVGGSQT